MADMLRRLRCVAEVNEVTMKAMSEKVSNSIITVIAQTKLMLGELQEVASIVRSIKWSSASHEEAVADAVQKQLDIEASRLSEGSDGSGLKQQDFERPIKLATIKFTVYM